MTRPMCAAAALSLVIGLAACGGGSSSSTPAALSFSPATLQVESDPQVSANVSFSAKPSIATSGPIYVVIDTQGVINPAMSLVAQADGSFAVTLSTDAALAAGRHTGVLSVRVCPVADCAQQHAGSPVQLPYDITVGTPVNLTALSRIAGVADWETHQGNAAHTGHAPITLDATRFSTRWRWIASDAGVKLSPPVAANGLVYVTTSGFFAPISRLLAIAEADASERWSYNFGAVFAANSPAVSAGAVFVATSGHEHTAMWSFGASDGALRFRTPFGAQWEHYYPPTVVDGAVYANGGAYGGLLRFDASTGTNAWFTSLQQYDQWTPAIDASYAYTNMGGRVTVLKRADGEIVNEFALDGFNFLAWSSHAVTVLTGNRQLLSRSGSGLAFNSPANTLSLIDTALGTTPWSVTGPFATDPVVAKGLVYIANASPLQLEARSLATGQVQWTWPLSDPADSAFLGNLLVTDSHVFVSTNRRTYAIDLTRHTAAWTYAKPAHKAISANGVLYLSTLTAEGESDRGLTAVNLR